MLEPTPGLFYSIVRDIFQEKATFATRSISRIELVKAESKKVETLAVGKDGIIFVNAGFWKKMVKTRMDAAIVLIHELFHVVTGDTNKLGEMDAKERYLANISMDMRINCVVIGLAEQFFGKQEAHILNRMYKPYGVIGMLRPGSTYPKNSKYRMIYNSLYNARSEQVDEEYIKSVFKSEESIREALKMLLPKQKEHQIKIQFIGNHGAKVDEREMRESGEIQDKTGEGGEEELDAKDGTNPEENEEEGVGQADLDEISDRDLEVSDDIKDEIADALKNSIKNIPAAGYSSIIGMNVIKVIDSKQSVNKRLLQQFACNHKVNELKAFFVKERRTTNVVPIRPGARDMAMLASGVVPVFWKNISYFKGNKNHNIAIYLDVSGSVESYLPQLLGIIKTLHRDIQKVYCFSNYVSEHSMQELSDGKYKTTGGTDFDCIAKHVLEHKQINKVIIFTDGYADLYHADKKKLKDQLKDAAVVYFGEQVNKNNFFQKEYKKGFSLKEILQ